jgi:hypothetical protein
MVWEMVLLRRFRGWFLFGAILVCAVLFAGLIHDFSQPDPSSGWLTGNPTIPVLLLGLGYLLMLAHRFSGRGE